MNEKYYLRSTEWFGKEDKMGFVHRSWLRNQGNPNYLFLLQPLIEICSAWSDFTPSNTCLHEMRKIVKMFIEHVEQADKRCDFDFLIGGSGSKVSRDLL